MKQAKTVAFAAEKRAAASQRARKDMQDATNTIQGMTSQLRKTKNIYTTNKRHQIHDWSMSVD